MSKTQEPSGYDEKTAYIDNEIGPDASVGEVAEYHASPEEERRLLWKLDLL
jgi:hypothetical protein